MNVDPLGVSVAVRSSRRRLVSEQQPGNVATFVLMPCPEDAAGYRRTLQYPHISTARGTKINVRVEKTWVGYATL